jgi:hypothetical protein
MAQPLIASSDFKLGTLKFRNVPWSLLKDMNSRFTVTRGEHVSRNNSYTHQQSVKSPSRHPVFGPPFTPKPLFQWYPQSKEILLNVSMTCWNSAFNAQGSRLIIVERSANICSSTGGAQEKGKTRWVSPCFLQVFFESHPVYDQTPGSGVVRSLLRWYLYYMKSISLSLTLGSWQK